MTAGDEVRPAAVLGNGGELPHYTDKPSVDLLLLHLVDVGVASKVKEATTAVGCPLRIGLGLASLPGNTSLSEPTPEF